MEVVEASMEVAEASMEMVEATMDLIEASMTWAEASGRGVLDFFHGSFCGRYYGSFHGRFRAICTGAAFAHVMETSVEASAEAL